jgi:hypothetical protein
VDGLCIFSLCNELVYTVGYIKLIVASWLYRVYYSWEQSDKSIDNRMESLKGYLTDELQALNVDTLTEDDTGISLRTVSTLRA